MTAITKAEFNGQALSIQVKKEGKQITLFLTLKATAKPGLDDILLKTDDGSILAAPLLITPAPTTAAKK